MKEADAKIILHQPLFLSEQRICTSSAAPKGRQHSHQSKLDSLGIEF
jgi:hypothetical protein